MNSNFEDNISSNSWISRPFLTSLRFHVILKKNMKNCFYYVFWVLIVAGLVSCKKQTHPPKPENHIPPGAKYSFKEGMVEYEIKMFFSIASFLYWKDYGKMLHQMTVVPLSSDTTHVLILNDTLYSWASEKAVKAIKLSVSKKENDYNTINFREITDSLLRTYHIEKLPDEKVDVYSCKVFKMKEAGIKLWVWEGIPVKVVGETPVVSFQMLLKKLNVEHPVFPAHIFELPRNVHFELVQDTITISRI